MLDFKKKKIDIRLKMATKKYDEAKKELMKIKMTHYNKLDANDKIFIDYNLALYSSKEGNNNLANIYLSDIDNIFKRDILLTEEFPIEYCNYLCLKTYENKDTMSDEEIVNNMKYIYEYYKSIDEYGKAIHPIVNICFHTRHRRKVIEDLEEIISHNIDDEKFIQQVLYNCSNINYSSYIEEHNTKLKYII